MPVYVKMYSNADWGQTVTLANTNSAILLHTTFFSSSKFSPGRRL